MRVFGPGPVPPPMTKILLCAGDAIAVDCDGPAVTGMATPAAQPSKHAPTMNEPVAENPLVPHALVAVTRQKYWVAMLRSTGTVKLLPATWASATMLVNAASRATWT